MLVFLVENAYLRMNNNSIILLPQTIICRQPTKVGGFVCKL